MPQEKPSNRPLNVVMATLNEMYQTSNVPFEFYQKFTCAGCGARQTVDVPNQLFEQGTCEECGHLTDMRITGCGYILLIGGSSCHDTDYPPKN